MEKSNIDIDKQTIVIDNGSHSIKAGFAGYEVPCAVFPTMVGYPKQSCNAIQGTNLKSLYIGDEAMEKRGVLNFSCPIQDGIVENWEDMEKIWHHTFYDQLRIAPEDAEGVLLTAVPVKSE